MNRQAVFLRGSCSDSPQGWIRTWKCKPALLELLLVRVFLPHQQKRKLEHHPFIRPTLYAVLGARDL